MIYRVLQFIRGLRPKISMEKEAWIKSTLSPIELELFKSLPLYEQQHSLNVALECCNKSTSKVFLRACLLHDIGKIHSNLTLLNKALVVLLFPLKNLPILPDFLKKAFYYKDHHPRLGGALMEKTYLREKPSNLHELTQEEKRIIHLIKAHHQENPSHDDELVLLQKADDLY